MVAFIVVSLITMAGFALAILLSGNFLPTGRPRRQSPGDFPLEWQYQSLMLEIQQLEASHSIGLAAEIEALIENKKKTALALLMKIHPLMDEETAVVQINESVASTLPSKISGKTEISQGKCVNCGQQLIAGDKFCASCGHRIQG